MGDAADGSAIDTSTAGAQEFTVTVTDTAGNDAVATHGFTVVDRSFTDVSPSHPFFEDIGWMAAEGISTGFVDGTYRPAGVVTRAAMSAFMHRLADGPGVGI